MKTLSAQPVIGLSMIVIVTSLSACASQPLPVTPNLTPPPADLSRSRSESVEQHSKEAQAWLSEVRALFEKWDALTKGCAATTPKSASGT